MAPLRGFNGGHDFNAKPKTASLRINGLQLNKRLFLFQPDTTGRPYNNTQSDGDDFAMCVFGRLSVTPLDCVAEVGVTPENFRFLLQRVYPV